MRLKFHGVRGSFPIGVSPSRIEDITRSVWEFGQKRKLKSWDEVRGALSNEKHSLHSIFGVSTTCVEIFSDYFAHALMIDAGTGLTSAGLDSESQLCNTAFKQGYGEAHFLFTHTHWDHIIGLPTIEQLYRVGNQFHIHGVHKNLKERLRTLFTEEHFPVPFSVVEKNLTFHQIPLNQSFNLGELVIEHLAQSHPGGSFAYKIREKERTLVFATDVEMKKNIALDHVGDFYQNADVLVMDAQYSPEEGKIREGYGHTDVYTAVDFAASQNVQKLYLFHHSPAYDDGAIDVLLERAQKHLVQKNPKSRLEISMAIEGQTIEI